MSKKAECIELDEVVIRFSGDSGDGMQLTGTLFSDTSALIGNDVSTFPDYPAEIRAPQGTVGGVSGFQIHLGDIQINTPGDYADVLVAMNPAALKANAKWVKKGGTIVVNSDSFDEKNLKKAGYTTDDPIKEEQLQDFNIIEAPIVSLTREAVKDLDIEKKSVTRCKNMFALGIVFWLYNRPLDHTELFFKKKFQKAPLIAEANKRVLRAGYNYAITIEALTRNYCISPAKIAKGTYRNISGNVATAWGLIAAAEKAELNLFCGSYPITPATEILQELSNRKSLGVKTFQAEDEIAGICTAIGAAYTGSMAVTTTSGPGLALKSEAIGLAVMTELPLVIVNVQRGGPSTGLPTKTEQSDLLQALYGRNGESPVAIIAASSPSDCFDYAFEAARIALEHMTPVILLTDGFLANGSEPWRIPQMKDLSKIDVPFADKDEDYHPYARDVEKLVRSWGIPGTPGHEHRVGGLEKDQLTGNVSYDPENHEEMVKIRAEKVARIVKDVPNQRVYGDTDADLLVVSWGGTYGHMITAVREMRKEGKKIAFAHFNYINPLPANTETLLRSFKKVVVCELNQGQFALYLRSLFECLHLEQYNKVQGLPFTALELKNKFNQMLEA